MKWTADDDEKAFQADVARLAAKYPTEDACLSAITDALYRLEDLGWHSPDNKDPPASGEVFEGILQFSAGVDQCWIDDDGVCLARHVDGSLIRGTLLVWRPKQSDG